MHGSAQSREERHTEPTGIRPAAGRAGTRSGRPVRALFAALAVLSWVAPAGATPLFLTLEQSPDVVSSFLDVTYDPITDILDVTGFAQELDDGSGPALAIADGTFSLSATIDASGALSGGILAIGGTVASLGFDSGTLLTGDLTAFGFPDAGGGPLEFVFDVTGGDLASLYGDTPGGVILGGNTGFAGSFAVGFDNLMSGIPGTGTGSSNAAPVPEPATGALVGLALAGLGCLGRRRPARS